MKLVLTVQSGQLAGQRSWLRLGERILVGRTAQAELTIPDPKMSSVHFFVECQPTACRVHDTRSTNGTLLNGRPISDEILEDGDVITAGDTTFLVQITSDAAEEGTPTVNKPAESAIVVPGGTSIRTTVVDPHPEVLAARRAKAAREAAAAKVLLDPTQPRRFAGNIETVKTLVGRLADIAELYLVVNFARLGQLVPAMLVEPEYLYDWIPGERRAGWSPVVISRSVWSDWDKLLELAWGHDSVLCLFSSRDPAEIVAGLRGLTLDETHPGVRCEFAQPQALAELLGGSSPTFPSRFFAVVDAVLLEIDYADACRLHVSAAFAARAAEAKLDLDVPPS